MPDDPVSLKAIVSDYEPNSPLEQESVVVHFDADGKPRQVSQWNLRWLGFGADSRTLRVTNSRNPAAIARIKIPNLLLRDKSGLGASISVVCEVRCDPGQEESVAEAIARHTENPKRPMRDRAPRTIDSVVTELIEDWLRTEVLGKEYLFLVSLLPGHDPSPHLARVAQQARHHLSLTVDIRCNLNDADKLGKLAVPLRKLEVYLQGFTRGKVAVGVRAEIRPKAGEELVALASMLRAPSLSELVYQCAIAVLESEITLDDLHAKPPTKAKRLIRAAVERVLDARAWEIVNMDVDPQVEKLPDDAAKIAVPFEFQLTGLQREWSGKITFLMKRESLALYMESGIKSILSWASEEARTLAVQALSAHTYESLLGAYVGEKARVEDSLKEKSRANGYSISGFNLTTDLPIETLSGVIRTPEKQKVEFATRFPNCKIKLTYFVEYHFPDFNMVRTALLTNEDVPGRVAASVEQVMRDELRATELLDFYFHFEVSVREGVKSVREALVEAIRKRLYTEFGAQVRGALMVLENDEVLTNIQVMLQPARQGALPAFDIPHARLRDPIHVQTLVFLVGQFAKEHFYQFVVTKPTISDIAESVRTHCAQWLADAEPDIIFGVPNHELRRRFDQYVSGRIQQEFGVTISIANFILGRHEEVLNAGSVRRAVGERLRFWQELLPRLEAEYRDAIVGDDEIKMSSYRDKIENAQKEIAAAEDELRRHEKATRRRINTADPKQLMPGSSTPRDDDDGAAKAAGS